MRSVLQKEVAPALVAAPSRLRRTARRIFVALIQVGLPGGLLLAGGGLLLLRQLVSYEDAYAWLKPLSASGKLESFTPARFADIKGKMMLAGGASVLLGLLIFGARRWLVTQLLPLVRAVAALGHGVGAGIRRFRRTETLAHQLTVLAIGVGGLLTRLSVLRGPVRTDEAYTLLRYGSMPLVVGLSNYSEPNNHLFHTLLVHISTSLFGFGLAAMRLPALLFGLLLLPLIYVAGRTMVSRTAGTLAMALTAVSTIFIDYSVNARGYTILMVMLVCVWLSLYRLRGSRSLPAMILLAVSGALGIWTIPVFLYVLAGAVVWHTFWLLGQPMPRRLGGLYGTGRCRRGDGGTYVVAIRVRPDRERHRTAFAQPAFSSLFLSLYSDSPARTNLVRLHEPFRGRHFAGSTGGAGAGVNASKSPKCLWSF